MHYSDAFRLIPSHVPSSSLTTDHPCPQRRPAAICRGAHASEDAITSVRFNHAGDMLATGDDAGQIQISKKSRSKRRRPRFNQQQNPSTSSSAYSDWLNCDASDCKDADVIDEDDLDDIDSNPFKFFSHGSFEDVMTDCGTSFLREPPQPKFRHFTEFQSHFSELDVDENPDCDESVSHLLWCRPVANAVRLISSTDKTIKVWRISERDIRAVSSHNPRISKPPLHSFHATPTQGHRSHHHHAYSATTSNRYLRIPSLYTVGREVVANKSREFTNAHTYLINSLSLSSDEETLLSSDDLSLHLWNLNGGMEGVNILDLEATAMENFTEVITCTDFHPTYSHLFVHSTSRGTVKLTDLRLSRKCRSFPRKFEDFRRSRRESFISELISSISDVKFSPNGRFILARDLMTISLWDVHMENLPLFVLPIHEHLRPKLGVMYDSENIFDRFECAFTNDGTSFVTGGYNASLHAFSTSTGMGSRVEVISEWDTFPKSLTGELGWMNGMDVSRPVFHMDASPSEPVVAVGGGSRVQIYDCSLPS